MKRMGWGLMVVAWMACGDDASPTEVEELPAVIESEPVEPVEPLEPLLELHEWGLISERLGGQRAAFSHSRSRVSIVDILGTAGTLEGGAGPDGLGILGRGVGKPVIYAHLADGVDEHTFDLSVDVVGGNVVEHWPLVGEAGPRQTMAWTGVRAHRGECAERVYPSADDPACTTTGDDFCEAKDGAQNETSDGACFAVGGASFDHLFYRATMSQAPLPLEVVAGDEGMVTVRHRGQHAIAGRLVRVRASDPLDLRVVDPPPPGGTVEVATPTTPVGDTNALRDAIATGLMQLGLTEPERDAFLSAWHDYLIRGLTATDMPPTLEAPTDALLYWMPEADLDAHVRLAASDRVTMRRALLVRVGLAY